MRKIAVFDMDGTISYEPEHFSWLSRVLKKNGWEIFVVTGRAVREAVKKDLAHWDISYDILLVFPLWFRIEECRSLEQYNEEVVRWKMNVVYFIKPTLWFDDDTNLQHRVLIVP